MVILQIRGLLTAASTAEATVFWFISLEKLCHTQLTAMAASVDCGHKIVEVGEAEVKEHAHLRRTLFKICLAYDSTVLSEV